MDWKYLYTEPFLTRHVLAAHFVKNCENVFDVGCGSRPITEFLRGPHKNVICADPLMPDKFVGTQSSYKVANRLVAKTATWYRGNAFDVQPDCLDGYGSILLGFDPLGKDIYYEVAHIVEWSEVCVLEGWSEYEPWKKLKSILSEPTLRIKIDLRGSDLGDMSDSFPPRLDRELLVFK